MRDGYAHWLDADDYRLIMLTKVELTTSSASLDRSPKKNWVENAGNLPPYIRKLARAIEKNGHSLSSAIAIAISRVKAWAAGGDDVDADTRAKAAKALAQWESLKAKNKAKKVVKASREDGTQFLELSNVGSFNTELVRNAWYAKEATREREEPRSSKEYGAVYPVNTYIRELWTDFIIIECQERDGVEYEKVPYVVSGTDVAFGEPVDVELKWQETPELSEDESRLLGDILVKK